MQRFLALGILPLIIPTGPSCQRVEERVVHRMNCLVCHRPLDNTGVGHGIEDAHPWHPVSCTDCHGGNGFDCDGTLIADPLGGDPSCDGRWVYDQVRAHVPPGNSPVDLKSLSPEQLDKVDRDYLRFINPSDLRVVRYSCGSCHTAITNAVGNSKHFHGAGELVAPRFRAGVQADLRARFGTTNASDNTPVVGDTCSVGAVTEFAPPPVLPESQDPINAPTVTNTHEQILAKRCLNCHISSFGDNAAPGSYRSSGCGACHMPYAEDGLSQSNDPWVNKTAPAHPVTHAMETVPPMSTCISCHVEGARIGLSYQGVREVGGDGVPEYAEVWTTPKYGKPAGHYVVDEDRRNDLDETPPDVHFEAGMHCMDCHVAAEVHGDGHIYGQASCTVRTRCEDCHGDGTQEALGLHVRTNLRKEGTEIILTTKRDGRDLRVPQLSPGAQIAGHDAVHLEKMECVTCHAGWMPNCYGCHVDVDLATSQPYATTGEQTPGGLTETAGPVALWDLTLLVNNRGKYMPSMSAQRLFMALQAFDAQQQGLASRVIFGTRPRDWTDPATGETIAGFGQRPVDPHTTQRRSAFAACDRCHSTGDAESPHNQALLDITHGFGSQRFPYLACDPMSDPAACDPMVDGRVYELDATISSTGVPRVIVAQPDREAQARPLTLDEIAAMRSIVVPSETPVGENAKTDPAFPGFFAR